MIVLVLVVVVVVVVGFLLQYIYVVLYIHFLNLCVWLHDHSITKLYIFPFFSLFNSLEGHGGGFAGRRGAM